MRIYLDTCCYNRRFDDKSLPTFSEESKAVFRISMKIVSKDLELVTSFMLHYENNCNKDTKQRDSIDIFIKNYRNIYVGVDKSDILAKKVENIIKFGVKHKDAYHIASAILANCDYFITFDKKILKFKSDEIKIINPIDFIKIIEGDKNE